MPMQDCQSAVVGQTLCGHTDLRIKTAGLMRLIWFNGDIKKKEVDVFLSFTL